MEKTLIEYFYQYEKNKADQPFLHQPFGETWETYTWAEAGERARKLAAWLKQQCPKEKAHVSIISKNCREWFITDIAITMAGFVSVPFYPNLKGKELKEVIEIGDVDLLMIGKVEGWEDMKTGIPKDMPIGKFPQYKDNPPIDLGTEWEEIMATSPMQESPVPAMEDVWSIIFTSGTTGTPKGAFFKQQKLVQAINMPMNKYWFMLDEEQENRFFSYLPLNHIAERTNQTMAIRFGAEVFFTESLETFAKNLQEASPTLFIAVPRILTKFKQGVLSKVPQAHLDGLLSNPDTAAGIQQQLKAGLGLSKVRICIVGAAPMAPFDVEWWTKLGIPLSEGYGQTETMAHAAYAPVGGMQPGKVGMAHEGMTIRIDEDTNEILLQSPLVMNGYYKDPEKTAETIRDGWLHTGDAGKLHEDGYLSITGRVKDTFKTEKGKYIIPNKVENLFGGNSDIEQMCLLGLGMPHPILIVVPSENGSTKAKEDLEASLKNSMNEVNKDLPNYTRVGTIVVSNEPFTPENRMLTPTMKVKRFNVQEKYANRLRAYCEDELKVIWEQ